MAIIGQFLAHGANSKRGLSSDGITWSVSAPGTLDAGPTGLAYSPALGVAVNGGIAPTVQHTTDALTYTGASSEPFTSSVRTCCWSPERAVFIAGGEDARIASSTDGDVWTQRLSSAGGFVRGSAWSPSLGLFVATCASGALIYTSPDGVTWTSRTHGFTFGPDNINTATWSPELGLFVVAGEGGGAPHLETSPTGTTWTARTVSMGSSPIWCSAYGYASGTPTFVIGGLAGNLSYSTNGTTWTSSSAWTTAFGAVAINTAAWSDTLGLFVIAGDTGKMMTSPDGITWTSRTSGFGTDAITNIVWCTGGRGLIVRGQIIYR